MVIGDPFGILISALSTDYLCQDKEIFFLNKQFSILGELFFS